MKNSKLLLKTALISSMAVAPLAFGNGGIHQDNDAMTETTPTERTTTTTTTGTTDGAIVTDETSTTASTTAEGSAEMGTDTAMTLPASVIKNAEQKLSEKGYTITKIDGVMDAETRSALEKFQTEEELKVTSMLNEETLDELDVDYEDAVEAKKDRSDYAE